MFGLFAVIKTTSLIKSEVFGELLYLFNHYQLLIHSDQPEDISFITFKATYVLIVPLHTVHFD